MPTYFDQQHLQSLGFTGFAPLHLTATLRIPDEPGIYAVLLDPPLASFLDESVGGHFKQKNPTVDPGILQQKWVPGTPTMYIGRANALRKRIGLLRRYGQGEPVAHQGGRYLWQLAEHKRLRIAWRRDDDPIDSETSLLAEFERTTGRLPFANLVRGTRPVALV